jgi:hypothetical protein
MVYFFRHNRTSLVGFAQLGCYQILLLPGPGIKLIEIVTNGTLGVHILHYFVAIHLVFGS